MPNVNFYIKAPNKRGQSLIILQFKYHYQTLVFTFNQFVDPRNWNADKQRVKNNEVTNATGEFRLNELLGKLEELVQRHYRIESINGIPPVHVLKKHLQDFVYHNIIKPDPVEVEQNSLFGLIDRFISGEIKYRGKDKAPGTLSNYSAVKKHLIQYQEAKNVHLSYDTIDLSFFYSYTHFLAHNLTPKLSPNSIAKDVRLLKVFLNEAIDMGYSRNMAFKHKKFTVAGEDTDAVYLTESEIMQVYHHDFKGHKKLENARDLFVVGLSTGLRHSDFSTIKPENIVMQDGEIFIKKITKKTNDLVIIPCDKRVLEIFEKYKHNPNRLPRAISSQKFNDYIKQVCNEVGLTELGRLSTDPALPLYQCVTSHTCRRSYITNRYLEGFPVHELMKLSGHKTMRSFEKYLKISKLDAARKMVEHNKRKDCNNLLKKVAA